MVAYCGPGDTVTSFYTLVGERSNYQAKIAKHIFLLDIKCDQVVEIPKNTNEKGENQCWMFVTLGSSGQ